MQTSTLVHIDSNTENLENILLTISYDGTDFSGWQKQTKKGIETQRTVSGEIEKALSKILKHETKIFGSGRTDSGVHALGQIANFFSDLKNIKPSNYIQALNSILPKDIRILQAKKVSSSFHARFNSKSRTYRYFCNCQNFSNAFTTRYSWNIRRQPDILKLNRMANYLRGELDFTSFASSGDKSKSKNRYVENAHFFIQNEMLVFEITANAFLWKMVRSLLGTMIELEKKSASEKDFNFILNACDRKLATFTAPAKGLFLWNVEY